MSTLVSTRHTKFNKIYNIIFNIFLLVEFGDVRSVTFIRFFWSSPTNLVNISSWRYCISATSSGHWYQPSVHLTFWSFTTGYSIPHTTPNFSNVLLSAFQLDNPDHRDMHGLYERFDSILLMNFRIFLFLGTIKSQYQELQTMFCTIHKQLHRCIYTMEESSVQRWLSSCTATRQTSN